MSQQMNEREMLIGRLIDGEAGPAEWSALQAMAESDPAVWAEVAEAQRVHALLTGEVRRATTAADRVDAPTDRHVTVPPAVHRMNDRVRQITTWGGWAAAAALLLTWAATVPVPAGSDGPALDPSPRANLGPASVPDLLQAYLDKGKRSGDVIEERPNKVLIEATPMDDGRYEVVFERRILEKAVVEGLFRFSQDEAGRAVPIQVSLPAGKRPM
jgi:hypothetical protein